MGTHVLPNQQSNFASLFCAVLPGRFDQVVLEDVGCEFSVPAHSAALPFRVAAAGCAGRGTHQAQLLRGLSLYPTWLQAFWFVEKMSLGFHEQNLS